jgi:anti-sigma factor RsiW
MGRCDQYGIEAQLYFDNELKTPELEEFRAHLSECPICQEDLQQASELSEALHSSRPLFSAPDELVKRVAEEITKQSGSFSDTPVQRHTRVSNWVRRAAQGVDPSALKWRALAAAVLFIAIALTLVPTWTWHVGAASYADAALRTHDSYLAGNLPPEIVSSSPETVTAWFGGKVPFNFRLPASQPAPEGQRAYRLIGARLVRYKDNYAALVVYEMKTSKISLMVTSDKSAAAAGGDEVQSGGLTFHYHVKDGMNVITWSNHGLTYALVSSVQGSVRGSCLVCHQNMADQNRFEDPH